MKAIHVFCAYLFCFSGLMAQDKTDSKFRKVTPADFIISSPVVDSNANAVILADVGNTDFVGNANGDFSLVFKQRKRILLRNRNAFEAATVKVLVYLGKSYSSEEKFEDFEAITYNLENGQVVATKLDKASVFNEKLNRESVIRKFTFPNIREGSIIEYRYTIKSPFYTHLRPWYFQDAYPCLWSEYSVTIPPMFNYVTIRKGYLPYTIDSVKKVFKNYSIIEQTDGYSSNNVYTFSGDATSAIWAIKNVPAFKSESYTSAPKNHISSIQFQLHSITYSKENVYIAMKDWYATTADLMKDPDFGSQLHETNDWINDWIKKLSITGTDYEKANKIFQYIRDNFTCTDHNAIWLSQPLKKTMQLKTGNVIDINLLLTAIFISQGFDANPVLLSTRDNGYANEGTPLISQYNYALSRVKIDDGYFLLDASQNRLGFGKLTQDSYNVSGRIINSNQPALVSLSSDSLVESKVTTVFIINGEKSGMEAGYTTNLGYLESLHLRNKLAGTKEEDYFKEISKDYPAEIKISNIVIDSVKQYDEPISIKYDMKLDFSDEDVIYFNPLFNEAWKNNPFISAERLYPVEMPYRINETYVLNMEIPKGYMIDEIPKSERVNLNDNEGMFEYIVSKRASSIQLRCRLSLEKAVFRPDDYAILRNFFGYVVKKQAEQIVFKRIK